MNIPHGKYKLIFRYRNNSNNSLEEIEFVLNYPIEEPIDVAEAMVRYKLLRGRDAELLSFNIKRLLKFKYLSTMPIYFPLYDEKRLLNLRNIRDNGWKKQKRLKKGYGCLFISNDYLKKIMYTFR